MIRPHTTRLVVASALALVASLALAQAKLDRKLGTCGPPPRKDAQRQTSAEGMPPLPLPVTPLRRSEPKAEPAPPLMIAKLEYGTNQDWNTDPGDADNLMRHCRYELGVWYGWKTLPVADLVAQHKAGTGSKIPILYVSGHEAFSFTPEQRGAIRQYVLDGGTLLGDACCGRDEFTESFRREAATLFPDRPMQPLDVDHPIYRSFYKYTTVHYLDYEGGSKKEFTGPPQILGLNVGCRAAVLLSPYDLSCGWDEHSHDRGKRVIPGDAIRLGINMVAYAAAMRPVGEAQAVTREVIAPPGKSRDPFKVAQLRHQGDWNPDPNSVTQWLRHLASDSTLAVGFDLKALDADESKLAPYPFLFLTGHGDPKLTDREVEAIRKHVAAGGFLFINNCCGHAAFDRHARALVKRIFPDQELAKLAPAHPIYKSFFAIQDGRDRRDGRAMAPTLEGIAIKDRVVLVYSKNDMLTQLKQASDPFGLGYDAETCRKLAVNIVAYALQN